MKKKHKVIKFLILVVVVVILGAGGLFYMEYTRSTTEGQTVEVKIPAGTKTSELVRILKEKGIIRFELPFYVKLFRSGNYGKLKYGTYELNSGMSLNDLMAALSTGSALETEEMVFTIPEGYSAKRIGERLEKQGIMSEEEFLQAVTDAAADFKYADLLPAKDKVFYQLEGYLFPDTYYLEEGVTGDELVAMLLEEFENQFDEDMIKQAKEADMSVEEVLIRASLVQKEADIVSDYPIVAGVINNRLSYDMRLQFDSTVVYAMTKGEYGVDQVKYSDLKYDSPYNTYMVDGLPAGPICNPGIDAIKAVLNPDKNEYLYFQTDTTKNDGSNLFFKTYEEHMAAYSTASYNQDTTAAESTTAEESTTEKSEEASTAAKTDTSAEKSTTEKSTTEKSTTEK